MPRRSLLVFFRGKVDSWLSEQASSFWNSKSSLAKAGEEASTGAFPEALGAQLKKDE
jgi:hypothetical protein